MKQIRRFLFLLTFIPMIIFQFVMIVLWLPLTFFFLMCSFGKYIAVGEFCDYGDFFLSVICCPPLIHERLTSIKFFHPDLCDVEE